MHPNDGRVVSNFNRQALKGEDITSIWRRHADKRLLARWTTCSMAAALMDHTPDDFTGPVNIGNPVETPVRHLAEKVIEMVGGRSKLVFRRCRGDESWISRWRGKAQMGAQSGRAGLGGRSLISTAASLRETRKSGRVGR